MKKPFAYILIILAITVPISTNIFVSQKVDELKISPEMYETPKGLKVIISALEVQIAANKFESYVIWLSAFLLGAGVLILCREHIHALKYRIEKLEGIRDKKP